MGHNKVKFCTACCSVSEQFGSIDYVRMCLKSYSRGDFASTQLVEHKSRSFDEVQDIRRQSDFLSMQSMASLPKLPKIEKVDDDCNNNFASTQLVEQTNRSFDEMQVIQRQTDFHSMQPTANFFKVPKIEKVCDEAKSREGCMLKEIELCFEPLPKGWEQCLDLKTGEIYYIDRSCNKRTKRDPRPILKVVEKDIHALISSVCGNAEAMNSNSSLTTNSSNTGSDIPILNNGFGYKKSVKGNGKLVILKGCRKCRSYILIPKRIKKCPSCKALLFEV